MPEEEHHVLVLVLVLVLVMNDARQWSSFSFLHKQMHHEFRVRQVNVSGIQPYFQWFVDAY